MEDTSYEIYQRAMLRMLYVSRLHRNVFEKKISSMGIHHAQHQLLMFLSRSGEVTSQKEIAEKFKISSAAVTRSLKTLENEGFIERRNTDEDSRRNKIQITDKGREIVEKTHIIFRETDKDVFADFTDDEINLFYDYLEKMQNRLLNSFKEGECDNEN